MRERFETVVLDSEGLALWVREDREMQSLLRVFHDMGADLAVSANTIIEVSHSKVNVARLRWVLSRIRVEPVTESAAQVAAELLKQANLHGHEYAIDATVAEAAVRQPRPVAVVTSDRDDIARLCGDRVHIIEV